MIPAVIKTPSDMLAVDTNIIIDYLSGLDADYLRPVQQAIETQSLILPPQVITELASARNPHPGLGFVLDNIDMLEITPGYWQRAGQLRQKIITTNKPARTLDCLIAQCCIDHDVRLLTRDLDFTVIAKHSTLRLLSLA